MGKRLNYSFVKKYIENEGYKLLSKKYENIHKKIEIECDKGHIFSMSFNNFKKGQRCPKCARENQDRVPKKPNNKKHSQEFIKELVESRGYKLLEPYVNKRTKLKLMCPKGHIHEIRLDSFQNGSGCKQCMIDNMKHDVSFVIKQLEKREFKLLSKYEGNNKNIVIQCKHGHIFSTTYDIIVNNNCGCPICNESKGEKKINNFLTKYKIKFNRQYKFENCKFYRCLPFDFYLPDYNCCIEFDGIQHYEIIKHFGNLESFIDRKIRDTVKNEYCKNNNIKLIRIPYWEIKNIDKILKQELFKHE